MPDYVFPSKLVTEKIEILFDFTDELGWGEEIFRWGCSVEVYAGTDDRPSDLLAGQAVPVGLKVKQKFYQGVPGVIYNLICEITGTTGAVYRKVGKLAILPDGALNAPFLASSFLTTGPYPVDVTESVDASLAFIRGKLVQKPLPLDKMDSVLSFRAGNLYGGSKTVTTYRDSVDSTLGFVQGNIFGGSQSVPNLRDSVQTGVLLFSANLFGSGIAYVAPPDKIQTSIAFQSGTLS